MLYMPNASSDHFGFTKGFTPDSQKDSKNTQGFTKGFTTRFTEGFSKDSQKDSPRIHNRPGQQRDHSGSTAGQRPDNSETTPGQQRDNSGTTAGQPRQQRFSFFSTTCSIRSTSLCSGRPRAAQTHHLRRRLSVCAIRCQSLAKIAGRAYLT